MESWQREPGAASRARSAPGWRATWRPTARPPATTAAGLRALPAPDHQRGRAHRRGRPPRAHPDQPTRVVWSFACFARAPGCSAEGRPSREFTWSPGTRGRSRAAPGAPAPRLALRRRGARVPRAHRRARGPPAATGAPDLPDGAAARRLRRSCRLAGARYAQVSLVLRLPPRQCLVSPPPDRRESHRPRSIAPRRAADLRPAVDRGAPGASTVGRRRRSEASGGVRVGRELDEVLPGEATAADDAAVNILTAATRPLDLSERPPARDTEPILPWWPRRRRPPGLRRRPAPRLDRRARRGRSSTGAVGASAPGRRPGSSLLTDESRFASPLDALRQDEIRRSRLLARFGLVLGAASRSPSSSCPATRR